MALRGEFMVGGPEAVTAYCMRRAKVCPTAPPHCLGQATPGLIDPSPQNSDAKIVLYLWASVRILSPALEHYFLAVMGCRVSESRPWVVAGAPALKH